MKETIKDIIIELSDDTIMIRDAKTEDLIRAKVYRPHEAVDKFKELCDIYKKKVGLK
jgi:hypothetical protein